MNITEEQLDEDKHFKIVNEFTSGADSALDDFLKNESFSYERNLLGRTYILFCDGFLIGYYTLKVSGIQGKVDGCTQAIPVIEIARIAVSFDVQHQGLGTLIFLKHIVPKISKIARTTAIYGVIALVDTTLPDHVDGEPDRKANNAMKFYSKIGFSQASKDIRDICDTFDKGCTLYVAKISDIVTSRLLK